MPERDLFAPFISRLENLDVPYFVTGSTAGMLYGEPRLTHDVDIVVGLASDDVHGFVAAFPSGEFYCPPEDVLAIEVRRGQRGRCSLIHHETGFKADIYIAYDDLHRWAFTRRRRVALDELSMSVAPVEYVILRKLEYFREGRADKHVRDIRGMLAVSAGEIDRAALAAWVTRLGLAEEWSLIDSGA